jgi:paraquat-inducible protein A
VVKGSKFLGRFFIDAKPWNMAQVFLIGVLVTMIKIASMATVIMGISFWAYVAFTIFITLSLTSLDSHKFWEIIE